MRPPRLSIARLMGLVLVSALGLVGLMRPDPIWASLTFTAAVVVLSIAVLNVIYSPRSTRPFWVGFSIAGWIFWMMAFAYAPSEDAGPTSMISGKALERFWAWLHPEPPVTSLSVTYTIAADGSMVPSGTQFVPTITPPPTLPSPLALIPPPVIPQPIDPPVSPDGPAEAAPVTKAAAASDPSMTSTAAAAEAVAKAMAGSDPSTTSTAVASPSAGPVPIATMPIAPPQFAITPYTTTANGTLYTPTPGASDWNSFSRIGQSLATLLAALLGGCYASFAARRKERIATSAAEVSPSSP